MADQEDVDLDGEAGAEPDQIWVVRPSVVRACVDELLSAKRHPAFPAYLVLRRQSWLQNTTSNIEMNWDDYRGYLRVPGGLQPNLRPFWNQARNNNQEWYQDNVAGSYSYRSISRQPVALKVFTANDDGTYNLQPEHWRMALENLLYSVPVPALAVAGFMLRTYGFVSDQPPGSADLVDRFKHHFGYGSEDNIEFDTLCDVSWNGPGEDWMEPA